MASVLFEQVKEAPTVKATCVHVIHNGKEIPGLEVDKEGAERGVFEQLKAWLKFYDFTIVPRGATRIVVLSPTMYDCRKKPQFEWPNEKD